MPLKNAINAALTRSTGYQLQRAQQARPRAKPRRDSDRLLTQPGFVLSSVRSGSTLVRVILDSHSQLHAPVELHLRNIEVGIKNKYARRSLREVGLDATALQELLWDRVLHRELTRSGKKRLVNKTPNDVFIADRIKHCWPDAKFIFLLRHPEMIARSRQATRKQDTRERNLQMVLRYTEALEHARQTHDGLTIRYEDLTSDPERVTKELCAHLGVPWEREMLDYGRHDHGSFKPGLGDWKDKIKSGEIHPAELPPRDEVSEELRPIAEAWGYL